MSIWMARLVWVFLTHSVGEECMHIGILTDHCMCLCQLYEASYTRRFGHASHNNCKLATCTAWCDTGKLLSVSVSVAQQQNGCCAGVQGRMCDIQQLPKLASTKKPVRLMFNIA